MEKKIYTRIDNRLVMDMEEPKKHPVDYPMSSNLYKHWYEKWQEYNSRPSYPINQSDEHLFKEGQRYELGKDFKVRDKESFKVTAAMNVCQVMCNIDKIRIQECECYQTKIESTAFAIHKDNDMPTPKPVEGDKDYWQKRCEAAELCYDLLNLGIKHRSEHAEWQQLKSQQPS